MYVLETDAGDTIMVTESGRAPNINVLFDTASTKYSWLNKAVGYATGSQANGVVSLNVWQVCIGGRNSPFLSFPFWPQLTIPSDYSSLSIIVKLTRTGWAVISRQHGTGRITGQEFKIECSAFSTQNKTACP